MNTDLDKLPPIKESELLKLGVNCAVCGKPQLAGGGITFYRVRIERAGFMRDAIHRRIGLGMAMGSQVLASIMGPDEPLARVFDGPHDVFVHEDCAHRVNSILELVPKAEEKTDVI